MINGYREDQIWSYLNKSWSLFKDNYLITQAWKCISERVSDFIPYARTMKDNIQIIPDYIIKSDVEVMDKSQVVLEYNPWIEKYYNKGFLNVTNVASDGIKKDYYEALWYNLRLGFTTDNINTVISLIANPSEIHNNLVNYNIYLEDGDYASYKSVKILKYSGVPYIYTDSYPTTIAALVGANMGVYYINMVSGLSTLEKGDIIIGSGYISTVTNVIGIFNNTIRIRMSTQITGFQNVTVYKTIKAPSHYWDDCLFIDIERRKTFNYGGLIDNDGQYLLVTNKKFVSYNGQSGINLIRQYNDKLKSTLKPPTFSGIIRRSTILSGVNYIIPNEYPVEKEVMTYQEYYGFYTDTVFANIVNTIVSEEAKDSSKMVNIISRYRYPISELSTQDSVVGNHETHTVTGLNVNNDLYEGMDLLVKYSGDHRYYRIVLDSVEYYPASIDPYNNTSIPEKYVISFYNNSIPVQSAGIIIYTMEEVRNISAGYIYGSNVHVSSPLLKSLSNYTPQVVIARELPSPREQGVFSSNEYISPFYDIQLRKNSNVSIQEDIETVMGHMKPVGNKIIWREYE